MHPQLPHEGVLSANSQYPIAIDIAEQSVRVAQFTSGDPKPAVRSLAWREVDTEDNTEFLNALTSLVKGGDFQGSRASVHLPADLVASAPLRFEVGAKESVEAAIMREAEHALPFPIDEAIVDYASIQKPVGANKEYSVLVVAALRDDLERLLTLVEYAGLTPEVVDFGVSSLLRLHRHLFGPITEPTILWNMGETQNILSVVTEDGIPAHRTVAGGANALIAQLMSSLELTGGRDNAHFILGEYGLVYDECAEGAAQDDASLDNVSRAVYQIVHPIIEQLVYEVHSLTGYIRSELPDVSFGGVYLYGEASRIQHVDSYIENRVNITTKVVNPMTHMHIQGKRPMASRSEGTSFALALGLALRKVPWL